MSQLLKWSLRITLFFAVTFLFLISGIFSPQAESLRIPIARLMTWFRNVDFILYADYYSVNLEHAWLYIYVFFNVLAGIAVVVAFECVVKLAKKID